MFAPAQKLARSGARTRQIEYQHLGLARIAQLQRAGVGELQRIPGRQRRAIGADLSARDVQGQPPARRQLERRRLRAVEQAGIHTRVLMDQYRLLRAIRRCDQPQAATPLRGTEVALFVAPLDAALVRHDPDLQEVHRLAVRGVELAVLYAAARAHALHVARADGGTVAHRILVRQAARQHVCQYLHVAMSMRAEARPRQHAVLVDYAQRSELDVLRVEVVGERKSVERLEPAVIGVAALGAASDLLHEGLLSDSHGWGLARPITRPPDDPNIRAAAGSAAAAGRLLHAAVV